MWIFWQPTGNRAGLRPRVRHSSQAMLVWGNGPRPFPSIGAYSQYCSIYRRQPSYSRIFPLSNFPLGKKRWGCAPNPAGHFCVQQFFPLSPFRFFPQDLPLLCLFVRKPFPWEGVSRRPERPGGGPLWLLIFSGKSLPLGNISVWTTSRCHCWQPRC